MIFPTDPAPRKLTPGSRHQTYVSTSRSLRRQVQARGGHLWTFDLSYPALPRHRMADLLAFLVSQRGRFGTFAFRPSLFAQPLGSPGASVPVVAGSEQTGRILFTSGWEPGKGLRAGDFLRLEGHTKCYMVTAAFAADSLGNASISFEPSLFQTPADGELLVIRDVDFHCALTSDEVDATASTPDHVALKVSITEVVAR